jgi:hypothetical protein
LSSWGLGEVRLGSDISADVAEASAALEEEATERIRAFLQLRVPESEEERARLQRSPVPSVGKISTVCYAGAVATHGCRIDRHKKLW